MCPEAFHTQRVHDDRRIERDDVVAQLDRLAPPRVFDVALEHGAQRAVVPKAVDAAVDLARLEDEAPALRKRGDLVHRDEVLRGLGLHRGC